MPGHQGWDRMTWENPLPHDYTFAFGIDADDTAATKNSTIVPFAMQDNAIVDYETIKTNKENDDFAIVAKPHCAAGSYVPRCLVTWKAFIPDLGGVEVNLMNVKYLPIHTAMLNRLDAFDKKTTEDIETILELTHETTDEQCYPLYNNVKLYQGHQVLDLPADMDVAMTADTQIEGVAFDMEKFFDALHYYSNKEMLKTVTDRMMSFNLTRIVGGGPLKSKVFSYIRKDMPSICKFMQPYTFYGGLFHIPQVSTVNQYHIAADTSAIEHLTILGRVRFNEFNPDFNHSRA